MRVNMYSSVGNGLHMSLHINIPMGAIFHVYWVEWLELWWKRYCSTELACFYRISNIGIHFGPPGIMCLVFSIPRWFRCTSDRAFLYKVFGRTILLFFKRILFCTQSSCKSFEKGCKLSEFFGQLLSLRVFITKFTVLSIRVSFLISSISIDWDTVSMT